MAKATAKREKKSPEESGAKAVSVTLDVDSSTPFFYVNCFEISGSANDFYLTGVRMPLRLSDEQKEYLNSDGKVELPADIQIIFPPRIMPILIKALTSQWEAHKTLVAKSD